MKKFEIRYGFNGIFFALLMGLLAACGSGERNMTTPLDTISRVSVSSDGTEGDGESDNPALSADGRYVAFNSNATNLVIDDTNGVYDIFIHDTESGNTTRVSVDSNGTEGNSHSFSPALSADSRYVVFESYATNLVDNDTNGLIDVFIHDTESGNTTRVSVDSNGTEGNSHSISPAISADGRYVVFESYATNLVDNDTNGVIDIFIHDTESGNTTRVSVASNGSEGNNFSRALAINADGRYVVFESNATNLVDNDTNGARDIFIHDTESGNTTRVSVASNGSEGNSHSFSPALSTDGRYVVFRSDSKNLVDNDTNGVIDIFIHDRDSGTTTRVSLDSNGNEGNSPSYTPAISADGRYAVFESYATNLVDNDTNGVIDIFIHDRDSGNTTRVSLNSNGNEGNSPSYDSAISADGRYVVFESNATNLVDNDTNGLSDIFRALNQ